MRNAHDTVPIPHKTLAQVAQEWAADLASRPIGGSCTDLGPERVRRIRVNTRAKARHMPTTIVFPFTPSRVA